MCHEHLYKCYKIYRLELLFYIKSQKYILCEHLYFLEMGKISKIYKCKRRGPLYNEVFRKFNRMNIEIFKSW
jgi:hypothetical protein